MNFIEFAHRMWPVWILGVMLLGAVFCTEYKDILRFNRKAFFKFVRILTWITLIRIILVTMLPIQKEGISALLPLAGVFFTYWEEALFTIPLAIFRRILPGNKLYYLFLIMSMISFGSGHTYQGIKAATLLSLYVPFSVKMGTKYGFGTMIVCHILYDLVTLGFAKVIGL